MSNAKEQTTTKQIFFYRFRLSIFSARKLILCNKSIRLKPTPKRNMSLHSDTSEDLSRNSAEMELLPPINFADDKYPYCIVWTPIPVLTWFFPFIGHMGIAMSNGVIRDFAGPYFVSEDNMGFGRPTRYLRLHPANAFGGTQNWDESVIKASATYGARMHNLFCDNCHSHVGMALALMRYKEYTNWNMVVLAFWMFFRGKYVGLRGFIKTWLPFLIILTICALVAMYSKWTI